MVGVAVGVVVVVGVVVLKEISIGEWKDMDQS
jgi:hypothetical protein